MQEQQETRAPNLVDRLTHSTKNRWWAVGGIVAFGIITVLSGVFATLNQGHEFLQWFVAPTNMWNKIYV